jgi:hypothetical protein
MERLMLQRRMLDVRSVRATVVKDAPAQIHHDHHDGRVAVVVDSINIKP